jgi:hypothetical protein
VTKEKSLITLTPGWQSWLAKLAGKAGWQSWLAKLAGKAGWKSWLAKWI